ncbi:MAG: hypothetical protein JW798_15020 [Prolixibacteraceae bacterium]|nr:hypothetical protein [Prolixibacteraceae bacterium]
MRFTVIIIVILLSSSIGFSQDLIQKKDGKSIECQITKEDSANVYFDMVLKGQMLNTYLSRSAIDFIIYEKEVEKIDIGTLHLIEGEIKDEEGYTYLFTKEVKDTLKQRSLYSLSTVPAMQIDNTKNQISDNFASFQTVKIVSEVLSYLWGALLGDGLYEYLMGDEEVGGTLMAIGGVGFLGTMAIVLPVSSGIGKKNISLLEENIVNPHNQKISKSESLSYYNPGTLKIGFGIQNVGGATAPSVRLVYNF